MEPSICIISGRYPASEFESAVNHKAYAAEHGYTYINCNWPTGARNPYMNKFMYILEYVHLFDWVFWIDDDAFFVDLEKPLEYFLPQNDNLFLSACRSPDNKSIRTYLSSGQFLLKGGGVGEEFVRRVLSTPVSAAKDWWSPEMGFFTNGDQDVMVYLLHTVPEYADRYVLHDHRAFNSRFEDFERDTDDVFLLHFTGPQATKISNYRKSMRISGRGMSLLPSHIERSLTNMRPIPMPTIITKTDALLRPFLRRVKRILVKPGRGA